MRIVILVEGRTEKVFLPHLRRYLESHLSGNMPKLDSRPYDGQIPTHQKLRRIVRNFLEDGFDHVLALTDVYTGTQPPVFQDAADAKRKMREWVGEEPRFHPHAAQYDFEAWLLPYWSTIQRLAGHNRAAPGDNPENVNHDNPPAHRLKELFRIGARRAGYSKPRDAARILRENNLDEAISRCAELRDLVNTILKICNAELIR